MVRRVAGVVVQQRRDHAKHSEGLASSRWAYKINRIKQINNLKYNVFQQSPLFTLHECDASILSTFELIAHIPYRK